MYKLFLKQNGSTVLHGDYLATNANDEKIEAGLKANEEKILSMFPTDAAIVFQCLERLDELLKKEIQVDDIFDSDLCLTLFTKIRPKFRATTEVGKKCRTIIKKIQVRKI